jgi:hypothetical protein
MGSRDNSTARACAHHVLLVEMISLMAERSPNPDAAIMLLAERARSFTGSMSRPLGEQVERELEIVLQHAEATLPVRLATAKLAATA